MYVVSSSFDNGEPLYSLIQWHWQIFDEGMLDERTQIKLLEKIINSDWDDDSGKPLLDGRELYSPLGNQLQTSHREKWEEFCIDVRHEPNCPLPFDDYYAEDFAPLEERLPPGTILHRARRGYNPGRYGERLAFQGGDLSAPPREKVLPGRANAKGQPVLYCADEESTAVAEVRPPKGSYVSVGTLRLNREARILDLAKEHPGINPFLTESLGWQVQIQSLLNGFAEEMSRPLERDDDETHYLPCQRLADFIRNARFDGIRYPSAVSAEGSNVVLFDSTIADVVESRLIRVTTLSLEYEVEERPHESIGAVRDLPRR